MAQETEPSGIHLVEKQIRASYVTTSFEVERMLADVDENPDKRRGTFEKWLKRFQSEKMADPWIYEPAILDNYGVFDDFAYDVYSRHNYIGVQNIVAHMENPIVIGEIVADPEKGTMLHWPGFDEYSWVAKCGDWHDFMAKCVEIDEDGQQKLAKNSRVTSRLWLSVATCWADYYNPAVNPHFDEQFPEWREASVKLHAMLYDRNEKITPERLSKRGYYLDLILQAMENPEKRSEAEQVINSHPEIIRQRL